MKTKIAVLSAVLALAAAPASMAAKSTGKAGAPGQVCKSLNVKGKKTAEQRTARKDCIKAAVAARKAEQGGGEIDPVDPYTGV